MDFKKTEFGDFPKQWTIKTIQTLIEENSITGHLDGNHGELYPRSDEFKRDGIPYITANDLTGFKVNLSNCKYLSPLRAATFKKGIAKSGDILFAHNATVGPTGLLETELDYVILSTTATYYRCNLEKLNNKFLLYLLQSPMFVRQYRSVMAQSTRYQVPITTQRKLSIFIPESKKEQEAIASALSDADAYIESLEKLIAKKRLIKKGVMQELLTGRRRLKGFSGEWPDVDIGEIAECFSGGTPDTSNASYYGGDIPWITSTVLNKKKIYQTEEFITDIGLRNSSAKLVNANSTLLALYGATAGVTAYTYIQGAINQAVLSINPYKDDSIFLFYKISSISQEMVETYTQGGQPNLSGNAVKKFRIKLPSLKEQEAIVQILKDLDEDLELKENKLKKARLIKQGMMQELLTGRIRLV